MPMGHVPRTLVVHVSGELTRSCTPGEHVIISGIFLPIPFQGFQAIKAGLTTEVYLQAMTIEKKKKAFGDIIVTDEMNRQIDDAVQSM